jgi:cytochrome c-type biogenesis protein CcmH/NrfG
VTPRALEWRWLYAGLVTGAVFWIAWDNGSYGLPSRGTLAVAIWWAVALGIMLGLARSTFVTSVAVTTGVLVAALAAWTLASTFWSSSAEASFAEFNRVTLYLGVYVLVVLLSTRRNVALWCNGLAVAIAAVAGVALASRLYPGLFSDRGLATFLPSSVTRLSFPLGYWNGLGVFVALGVPLLLRLALVGKDTATRSLALVPIPVLAAVIYLTSSRGGVATALVGAVVFLALTECRWRALCALLVTVLSAASSVVVLLAQDELVNGPLGTGLARHQGREATVLIAAACCATGVAYWLGDRAIGGRTAPARWIGALAALAAVAAVIVLAPASHPVRRFENFKQSPAELAAIGRGDFVRAHLLSGSGSGRWQFWTAAVDEWKEEPLRGLGAGSYEEWWSEHASFTYFVRDAHSLYLETLGELGIVGFLLVVAVVLVGLVEGARRALAADGDSRVTAAALSATFAGYAFAVGFDWMWELTAVSAVGFVALALTTGPATSPASQPRLAQPDERPPMGVRRRFGIGIAVLVLAWAMIGAQLIPLLAQRAIARSQAAAQRGDLADAEGQATAARDIQPWAASPYLQLALVAEQQGDLARARTRIDQALHRDPANWRLWLTAARIQTKLGDVRGAEQSLQRAVELNPRSPLFRGLFGSREG